jgi:hypothetical protein
MRIRTFLALPLLTALVLGVPGPASGADDWAAARKAFSKAQKSPDWKVRTAGYAELAYHDTAEAVGEALGALAREDNPAVMLTAIKTLAAFASKESTDALHKVVRAGRDPQRLHVILALAEQPGAAGKDVLLEVLAGKDAPAAAQAALALGRKKLLDARPQLAALLKDKEWRLRAAGARALRMLAGPVPVAQPGKPPPPRTAPTLQAPELWNQLVDALDVAEGRERADIIAALARFTGEDFGWDVGAWRAFTSGTKAADIGRNPRHPPYFFGVPVHGKRLVVLVDCNTLTENPHPFNDPEKLKAKLKVPGARPIPWAGMITTRQFIHGHVKRFLNDLPSGTVFEMILVGAKARPVFGKFTPANDGTKALAIAAMEEQGLDGPNDVFTALDTALDFASKKDSVAWDVGPDEVLYVDVALPWKVEHTDPSLIGPAIALKARLRMVPITMVGVGDHPFELCQTLAETTGGTYAPFMAEIPAPQAPPAPAGPPPPGK